MATVHLFIERIGLAPDHFSSVLFEEESLAKRFKTQDLIKDWMIQGPFETEEGDYYFLLTCDDFQVNKIIDIPKSAMFSNPRALELIVRKMIVEPKAIEADMGVLHRLSGIEEGKVAESAIDKDGNITMKDTRIITPGSSW